MKRAIAFICLIIFLATCAPTSGARLISPGGNIELALTVTNAALQSKGCQKLFAENYPEVKQPAIKIFTDEIWITMFQFDNVIVAADFIAAVVPHINSRRIMVNETFAAMLGPIDLGETIIHEFFHLMDFKFGTEEQELVTEELSQLRAKACMDSLWKAYPEGRPPHWKDGPRELKVP